MGDILGNNVVNKNILDIINKNPNVEITQVKINPKSKKKVKRIKQKKPVTKTQVTKTLVRKVLAKKIVKKKDPALKHMKELKKHVKALSGSIRKRDTAMQKQLTAHVGHVEEVKEKLAATQQDVLETKAHYAHIPKLSMETQMLIESMNKLSAVVKQLLVLFNQKISNEEGPLFAKLDEIAEQNEKIAQGLLAIADIVKEQQTPKAQIREFNPYMPPRQQPVQVREQMPAPQEQIQVPADLGRFQFPQDPEQQQAQQMPVQDQMQPQPIPQFGAPLPLFSQAPQQQEPVQNRKRMLF
jgi:phytoene dehydrogenase-like protein